jgi:hypothetical protein
MIHVRVEQHAPADPVGPRVIPMRGVGNHAFIFVETADGTTPMMFLVERERFTDAQWIDLLADAEQWAKRLSGEAHSLRII